MSNKKLAESTRKVGKARKKELAKTLRKIQAGTYELPKGELNTDRDIESKSYEEGWNDCRLQVLQVTEDAFMDKSVVSADPLGQAILALTKAISEATRR